VSEQPGNSFRYLYWRLSDHEFQQLCAAILRNKYDSVRCYPVGMGDEGIDAIAAGSIIYQVKWSSKLLQNPDTWLSRTIEDERKKIEHLVRQKHISRYILMTSVAGTTTAEATGSIQKLQRALDGYTDEFGIPVECWWQSDIDGEVDAAPDSIKWSYSEMLAGTQAMRYLIYGSQLDGQAAQTRDTVIRVMASQWREDSKIKFSQVDAGHINVADLFVDVQVSLQAAPRNAIDEFLSTRNHAVHESLGAVAYLLQTTAPLTYLLGVPGQGKSTLGQYLSQIHRAAILPGDHLDGRTPPTVTVSDPKLPLRVDLKDYASWLSGRDPFGEDDPPPHPKPRKKAYRSLELFLADFCVAHSGGRQVSVEDVQSLLERYPTLLVLDGLDEVADPELRSVIVEQINLTATRMGLVSKFRRFQILVTARPNASGLAEPDKDIFQTLRLKPLTPLLQREFLNKWCDVNEVHGGRRRDLRRTFLDRTALDHVAQLADNPMQLTILLFLINQKGDAVPVSRTPLYTDYLGTLLAREVNREQIDRNQVPQVQEVTAFLGWHMHSGVEVSPTSGRMTRDAIETTLLLYLRKTDGPVHDVATLFQAASDRFWALTSKEQTTFEFVVQPVREYFAAKFLAEWAGRDLCDPLPKQNVLQHLIDRPFWLNTARFYAGFASPNELAGLRYGLEQVIEQGRHPLQERTAVWTLLSDGIFTASQRVQRDVVALLTDELTITLVASHPAAAANFPRLAHGSGGEQMAAELCKQLEADPGSPLAQFRVDILRARTSLDGDGFLRWWKPHFMRSVATPKQTAWLNIAGRYGVPRLLYDDVKDLALDDADSCQAALSANASPDPGTNSDIALLKAVLSGWCSDVTTSSTSEAGALLRAMRPQWFHPHIGPVEHSLLAPIVPARAGHRWLDEKDRARRIAAWKRLVEIDSRYAALRRACRPGMGQMGTTERWQNPARQLTRIHGPSWLAAEIAIAGVAATGTVASGSFDRGGEPFGERVDYGTFVLDVRRHPSADWWELAYEKYPDSLSRRTWCLALLATADTDVLASQLPQIDATLSTLSEDQFHAVASSSSRLSLSESRRQLGPEIWDYVNDLGDRAVLLITHFATDIVTSDLLGALSDERLLQLASPMPAAWPILHAINMRMFSSPNATLLGALARIGTGLPSGKQRVASSTDEAYLAEILSSPGRYPAPWVLEAESRHSKIIRELPLEEVALQEEWLPKIARVT
jgi:hypothetical protein